MMSSNSAYNRRQKNQKSALHYCVYFIFKRGYCGVIFMRSQWGEFKELLISRNLLEIELNGVHFWRLCFFELLATKIHFFDKKIFLQIPPYFLDQCRYTQKYTALFLKIYAKVIKIYKKITVNLIHSISYKNYLKTKKRYSEQKIEVFG